MFDNSLHIKIGKKIKEIRELKDISQQDLAARCNFEKSNMSRLEAGKVNLDMQIKITVKVKRHFCKCCFDY